MFNRKITIYPSGLRHIHYYVPFLNTLLMQYSFNVGSVDEDKPELYGISHFLEHMIFNGSKDFPDREGNDARLAQLGVSENAWTSQNETFYYMMTPQKSISQAFEFLTDMVFYPLLRSKDIIKEKGIIQEELVMYENDPDSVIFEDTWSRLFVGTDYANSIIGNRESIDNMNSKLLSDYHRTYYTADNCIFFTYGGVSSTTIESVVEKKFQTLKTDSVGDRDRTIHKVDAEPIRSKLLTKDIHTGYYTKMISMPSIIDPGLVAVMITLDTMLSGGIGSKLSQDLLYENSLVGSYSLSLEFVRGHIYIAFGATTAPDSIDMIKAYLQDEVLNNYEKFINDENLERAKNYAKGQLTRSLEDVGFLSSSGTKNIDRVNLYSQSDFSISDLINEMEKVDKKDILKLIKQISQSDMWAESSMIPK